MPQPTPGDLHVNGYLTQVSVAYTQDETKFIADKVFPRLGVEKQSNHYAIFDKADFLRDEMERRAPGSETAGGGYRVSRDSYQCEVWGFHVDVDDQTVANADGPFAPMRDATRFITAKELIKREVEWATAFFTTGLWTGSTTATDLVAGTDFTAWTDVASTPIESITDQMANVESLTGFLPNKLTINRRGWNALKNHPDILARISGGATANAPAMVSRQTVAALLELDEILVAAGVRNSAAEGLTGSYNYIAGNHALLTYSPAAPAQYEPSAGYTFVWSGYLGSVDGRRIKNYRLEELASERVEIESTWDQKLVAAPLGVFFQNVA